MNQQHIYAMTREGVEEVKALLSMDQAARAQLAARAGRTTPSESRENGGTISVIPVYGMIEQRPTMFSEIYGGTSTQRLSASVRTAAADPNVRAIILDVASGGGSVFGVHEVATDIRLARGSKPIVACVNSMACSAAYWIASAADEVVSVPSGVSGSIGVFALHTDVSVAQERAGIKTHIISAGDHKPDAVDGAPLSDAGRKAMQDMVSNFYELFVSDIAAGRRVSTYKVRQDFGRGLIMTAPAALKAGVIDKIETLGSVIYRLSTAEGRARAIHAESPQAQHARLTAAMNRAGAGIRDNGEAHRRLLKARMTI